MERKRQPTKRSIGIAFPFSKSENGAFEVHQTTLDAIKADLKVLLLTNYGDRVVHYDFGANLRPIIFEQTGDVGQKIIDAITVAVDKWMPFVKIEQVDVFTSANDYTVGENEVKLNLTFSVSGTALRGELGDITISA